MLEWSTTAVRTSVAEVGGHGWVGREESPWLQGRGHPEEVGVVARLFPQVQGAEGHFGHWGWVGREKHQHTE